MSKLLALTVLSCYFLVVSATYGLDLSQPTSQSSFGCLKGEGFDFAVVRCWTSVGRADPGCPFSVNNAWAAGMAHVDIYMFPCPSCGNPAGQVQGLINFVRSHNLKFGMLWFDIEGPGSYWGGDQGSNREFISALISTGRSLGINCGIYTSASQWNPIVGSWDGGSGLPLWYAHYDGAANFGDFEAFGGWSRPAIKQYAGNIATCGAHLCLEKDLLGQRS